jgi:hypothetical protein
MRALRAEFNGRNSRYIGNGVAGSGAALDLVCNRVQTLDHVVYLDDMVNAA